MSETRRVGGGGGNPRGCSSVAYGTGPTGVDEIPEPRTATLGQVLEFLEGTHGVSYREWLRRAADLLRSAHALHMDGKPGEVRQYFPLITGGADKGLDAIGICVELLKALEPDDRAAALAYLTSRFAGQMS